jgi:hypothetical protein
MQLRVNNTLIIRVITLLLKKKITQKVSIVILSCMNFIYNNIIPKAYKKSKCDSSPIRKED